MKKHYLIFITVILSSLWLRCHGNTTAPETNKGILVVQNKTVSPGEIVQLDDYPLFVMNYSGDYGFSNYKNSKVNSKIIYIKADSSKWGCTCFSAMADSCKIFGRNFDYHHHIALVLYTHPANACSSVSLADIPYLGFDDKSTAAQLNQSSSISRSPYCCVDGLNEKGVSIGLFTDKNLQPTEAEILEAVGLKFPAWQQLVKFIRENFTVQTGLTRIAADALQEDLKFLYGRKYGWALRFRLKGKLHASLYPARNGFTVQIKLKPEAVLSAKKMKLSKNTNQAIERANPYPEGRWLFIPVESEKDIKSIGRLLELKRKSNSK